ncbi:MAG: DMT family transporter [Ruminococcus sp.]|nr:DMT family transporter [Candidatus Apopatosoma intestinale]
MKTSKKALAPFLSAIVIFGTVGLVRRAIPLSSAAIAAMRGIVGAIVLLTVLFIRQKRFDRSVTGKQTLWLILSGMMIGFNWILLFEAYCYTSVAVATLGYYMAPAIVLAVSPLLFGEKLTGRKIGCLFAALVGMAFVSGVIPGGIPSPSEAKGVLLSLAAAVLYAGDVLINKKLPDVPAMEKTVIQLAAAGLSVLPYAIFTGWGDAASMTTVAWILLAVLCLVHTGLAYLLYFGAIPSLPAQSVALLAYLDPIVAILLSALILKERMNLWEGIGAVLIIGALMVSEISRKTGKTKENGV